MPEAVLRVELAKFGWKLDHVSPALDDLWEDADDLIVWIFGEPVPYVCPNLATKATDTDWLQTIAERLDTRIRARREQEAFRERVRTNRW